MEHSGAESVSTQGLFAPAVERRLRALDCRMLSAPPAKTEAWRRVRDIVVWLEEEKIRLYPRHKREAMRTANDPSAWWSVMLQYCRDLEVPLEAEGGATPSCAAENFSALLDVISAVAVSDIYQDALEASQLPLDAASDLQAFEAASQAPAEGAASSAVAADLEQLRESLNVLLAHLRLPPLEPQAPPEELVSALKAAAVRLGRLGPSPAEADRAEELAKNFSVACPSPVENASFFKAFVFGLRALHVAHMRDTQAEVNALIEALQALTANPVTDHRLGRVGV
ncbi:hypothetical protein BESB_040870 [Besnoitia besnoiti]|uniref:Uncharacterized protein n=1 Tax=Besnoitia besnoiti TaxID=94643 RepID=A0A2A9MI99_BESBE|nr:hypothetical protein BESB_040870 [Besnoitia besnoiti]PFH37629.1 hypothetical protein BESB_040870 [Besnoitia besnoiti]